jgi:hypothetical protein
MTRRSLAGALVALLVGALTALGVVPAAAATGTYLRLAHLSPDTPAVDVLVTAFSGATLQLEGVEYGDVSTYTEIEPGQYTLQMRPAGAPESTPPVVSATLDAARGSAHTAAGLGPRSDLAIRVLDDDLSMPGPGRARVRLVQGAEQAGEVSAGWNGAPAFDGVAFGTATDYATVPAGAGAFQITQATGPVETEAVTFDEGGVYSVVLVQGDGALDVRVATDATGTGTAPAGGIETGLGGAVAGGPAAGPAPALVAAALMALALVLGAAARRRVARRSR